MSELHKSFLFVSFNVLDTEEGVTYQTYERLWNLAKQIGFPIWAWNEKIRDRIDMTDGRVYLPVKEGGYALQDM